MRQGTRILFLSPRRVPCPLFSPLYPTQFFAGYSCISGRQELFAVPVRFPGKTGQITIAVTDVEVDPLTQLGGMMSVTSEDRQTTGGGAVETFRVNAIDTEV